MATTVPTSSTFLIFFLSILVGAYCRSGLDSSGLVATLNHNWDFKTGPPTKETQFQGTYRKVGFWRWKSRNSRRLMIGSTAPICTYNECRGCQYKCKAEQIPVDANDPINSAYRYICVCHR
ncbi:EPIDERMAL PATTERNING FACTOR-like protein 9 [Acorus gramineus]|uniref:EPIDERMAL PATTERNING FACTOR-like protein 9 n=1 Tax=Acorus gramineus TaxID=55184 RepID=A0AAV9B4T6_ACOGR|nr:EPIDERMAL PATTERNING FACTOR-like protein 9 [Acorus gramineus]